MSGSIGQPLTGKRKSTPKITRILADDGSRMIYKKMGDNHGQPFLWADLVTMAAGDTEVVVASGITFHGMDVATYGNVTATPMANPGGYVWIDKNTTTNVVKIKCSAAAGSDINYDVKVMLGNDPTIANLYCRGFGGPMPALP